MSTPTPFQLRITDLYVLMLFNFGYLWMWGKPPDTALIAIMFATIFAAWFFMLYIGRQHLKPDNERVYRLCLAVFLLTLPCNLAFSQIHQQSAKRHWIAKRNETLFARGALESVFQAEKEYLNSAAPGRSNVFTQDLIVLKNYLDKEMVGAQCDDPIKNAKNVRAYSDRLARSLFFEDR